MPQRTDRDSSGRGRLGKKWSLFRRAWKEWKRERCAMRQLRGMDDRLLDDIGLTRGSALALARRMTFLAVLRRVLRQSRSEPEPTSDREPARHCPCCG